MKTRKLAVDSMNHAMTRFPMILGVLEAIRKTEVPAPGDRDIEHGCERALTAIMAELAKIKPAPSGEPNDRVETTLGWVQRAAALKLIHADILERFQQLIERILAGPPVRSR